MARIDLDKTLAAPIDVVFELLSDHAGYTRFRGFSAAELLREGSRDRNGVGALRSLAVGPIRFEEEITAFDRPRRMDYLIRTVNLPLDHQGGAITLSPVPAGTRVEWRSAFGVRAPAGRGALGTVFAAILRRGFIRLLDDIERLAAEHPPPATER